MSWILTVAGGGNVPSFFLESSSCSLHTEDRYLLVSCDNIRCPGIMSSITIMDIALGTDPKTSSHSILQACLYCSFSLAQCPMYSLMRDKGGAKTDFICFSLVLIHRPPDCDTGL